MSVTSELLISQAFLFVHSLKKNPKMDALRKSMQSLDEMLQV